MLNYSSKFGTVRIKVMPMEACICHRCSLDGWIDWDVYTVTVGLFSGGIELPVAYCKSTDTKGQRCLKGRFTEKSSRVPSAY